MKKQLSILAIFAAILLAALAASPVAANNGKGEVIAITGIVPGQDLVVHILALVPPGADRAEVAKVALANQGARAVTKQEYTTISISWDQFFDSGNSNPSVTQNYNPSGEPDGDSYTKLTNSQGTWSGVATSMFAFSDGGLTGRCPSLVKECPGKAFFDDFNDVGWMVIKGRNILGVTWTGTNIDEADMALNTKFNWTNNSADYNIETVFLHENGHALGLGHSDVGGAVMWPSYSGMLLKLTPDDEAGVTIKYPAPGAIGLAVSTTSLPDGTVDSEYSATLSAVGGTAPYSWSITSGSPPLGLSLSGDTISGTPTTIETQGFTVQVTDSAGSTPATANLIIAVSDAPVAGTGVGVTTIDHTLSGGGSGEKDLRIKVNVADDTLEPVAGASVSIVLNNVTTEESWTATASTGSEGSVTFRLRNAPAGCYSTDVSGVVAAGLTWDEDTGPFSGICKSASSNKSGGNSGALQAE